MSVVSVNGVELYYEQIGEGDRIALTHGAWTDGRGWQSVAERLADRFELVIWDRRGHSRSQDGTSPGSYLEDAADLAGLIEHLGGEPVHLVGNSSGGKVVLDLIAIRPELAASAAVHEPRVAGFLPEGTGAERISQLMKAEEQHIGNVVELIEGGEHRQAAQYFIDEVAVGPGAWEMFPEQLQIVLTSNALTFLDESRDDSPIDVDALTTSPVPLLISLGTESSELEVAAATELARLLPAARVETLDEAGHIPHRTHPDVYAAMLTSFIGGLPGPAGHASERSQV
jgi:pimeloyl-ACP methyl ester carboxylesterase